MTSIEKLKEDNVPIYETAKAITVQMVDFTPLLKKLKRNMIRYGHSVKSLKVTCYDAVIMCQGKQGFIGGGIINPILIGRDSVIVHSELRHLCVDSRFNTATMLVKVPISITDKENVCYCISMDIDFDDIIKCLTGKLNNLWDYYVMGEESMDASVVYYRLYQIADAYKGY